MFKFKQPYVLRSRFSPENDWLFAFYGRFTSIYINVKFII